MIPIRSLATLALCRVHDLQGRGSQGAIPLTARDGAADRPGVPDLDRVTGEARAAFTCTFRRFPRVVRLPRAFRARASAGGGWLLLRRAGAPANRRRAHLFRSELRPPGESLVVPLAFTEVHDDKGKESSAARGRSSVACASPRTRARESPRRRSYALLDLPASRSVPAAGVDPRSGSVFSSSDAGKRGPSRASGELGDQDRFDDRYLIVSRRYVSPLHVVEHRGQAAGEPAGRRDEPVRFVPGNRAERRIPAHAGLQESPGGRAVPDREPLSLLSGDRLSVAEQAVRPKGRMAPGLTGSGAARVPLRSVSQAAQWGHLSDPRPGDAPGALSHHASVAPLQSIDQRSVPLQSPAGAAAPTRVSARALAQTGDHGHEAAQL